MSGYRVTSEPGATHEQRRVLADGLRAFNERHAGPVDHVPVTLFVRDDAGETVGGLIGTMLWGWLHVHVLWVADALRGQGFGTRLLLQAEAEAVDAGCTGALLDTFDFQALPFYQRHGYETFGVLEGFPPGHRQYYLRKQLQAGSGDTAG